MFFTVLVILTAQKRINTLQQRENEGAENTWTTWERNLFAPTWTTATPCSCAGNLILVVMTIVSCTAPQIRLIRTGMHQSKNRLQKWQIQTEGIFHQCLKKPEWTMCQQSVSGVFGAEKVSAGGEANSAAWDVSGTLGMFLPRLNQWIIAVKMTKNTCTHLTLPVICWTLTFRTYQRYCKSSVIGDVYQCYKGLCSCSCSRNQPLATPLKNGLEKDIRAPHCGQVRAGIGLLWSGLISHFVCVSVCVRKRATSNSIVCLR